MNAMINRIIFKSLNKWVGSNLIIPCYHIINNTTPLHVKYLMKPISEDEFKQDIEFFLNYFEPISYYELIEGKLKTNSKPKVLLTFDDGFKEIYDIVAPHLTRKGFPAIIFVPISVIDNQNILFRNKASVLVEKLSNLSVDKTVLDNLKGIFRINDRGDIDNIIKCIMSIDYNERHILEIIAEMLNVDFDKYLRSKKPYLTTSQIMSLHNDGFTIGAHSLDHPNFPLLSEAQQRQQILGSVREIKNLLNMDDVPFAFPFNDLGISKNLFDDISRSGEVPVTFGLDGQCILSDYGDVHYHRIPMEQAPSNETKSANQILKKRYFNKIKKALISLV